MGKILTLDNMPIFNRKIGKIDTIDKLLKSVNYKVGDIVEVLGYYSKGDGAGHPRQKKPEGYTGADAVIGADGSIWGIVHNGEVCISWFGAKRDFDFTTKTGTDISEVMTKALKYTNAYTSTPLKIDGAYYLNKTVSVEFGFLYLTGNSMPSRLFGKETWQEEKPSSYIYVDGDIVAFELGSKDSTQRSAPKFFVKNIVFQGKAPRYNVDLRSATLIKYTGWGSPSRPNCFYECQVSGFDKAFHFERNGHTNALLLNIQWNEFSSNNYTIYTPYQTTDRVANIGNLRFDNNINEQGSKLRITNLFGASSISYNLMESQNDLYNIHMEANSTLDIKGNYYEVNGGTWLFAGESNSKINFYDEFRDSNVTAVINADESKGLRVYKPREIKNTTLTDTLSLGDLKPNLPLLDNGNIAAKSGSNLSDFYSKGVFVPFRASRNQNPTLIDTEIIGFAIGSGGFSINSKGSFVFGCDTKGGLWYKFRKDNSDSDWIPISTQKQMGVIYNNVFPLDVNGDGGNVIHQPSRKPLFKIAGEWRTADGNVFNPTNYFIRDLDTPYHATQMSKLGILESYHNYLTELHEYEKSQNVQSDSEIMALNVLQPPVIPKEVEAYAKEYNLI